MATYTPIVTKYTPIRVYTYGCIGTYEQSKHTITYKNLDIYGLRLAEITTFTNIERQKKPEHKFHCMFECSISSRRRKKEEEATAAAKK